MEGWDPPTTAMLRVKELCEHPFLAWAWNVDCGEEDIPSLYQLLTNEKGWGSQGLAIDDLRPVLQTTEVQGNDVRLRLGAANVRTLEENTEGQEQPLSAKAGYIQRQLAESEYDIANRFDPLLCKIMYCFWLM